jgi:lipopolysaccharide export system protein LptA
MKRLIIITFILTFIMPGAVNVSRSYATETDYAEADPIECDGDKVEYFETEKKVVGTGDVVIKYKDITLTSDKMTVWTDTYAALAEGNVTLTQGDSVFKGESIQYNFKDNTGSVVGFSGKAEEWYVKGKDAKRISEEKIVVRKSYVTTCNAEVPHWKLSADRVEVYPDKMINTYNAIAWINPLGKEGLDVPIMWLPYYCHPLDDDRPHVTIVPGKSSEWGYYLLTAWRYHLTPNQKGYIHLDYREKKDIAVGADYIYDTSLFGKGNLFAYYMNERDLRRGHFYNKWRDSKDSEPTAEQQKYIIRQRHQWQATPQTLITAEFNKYEDEDILKDYFFNEYEKDEHPISYALATHSLSFGSISLLTQKRVNRFDGMTELLPEARFNIYNQRVGESRFYYKGDFKAVNMNKVYPRHTDDNPGTIEDSQHANIFDSYNQLSYQARLGPVSVMPFAGTKQTFLDRQIDNDTSIISGSAYTGVDISTKFYKVFNAHGSFFGIDLDKMRHVLTPTIGYLHVSNPTQDSDMMLSDGVSRSSVLSLGLENKLQTKRGKDGKQVVDLAMLLINTTYDFDHTPGAQFKDITGKLELRPYSWFTAASDIVVDPHQRYHHRWLKQINNNMNFNLGEKASLGIGHSYQAGANNIIAQARLDVIPGWRFSAYQDLDLLATRDNEKKVRELKEQEYVITKDLHCWEMDIRYNITKGRGEEIMLVFRLKAFPEVPFAFGKSYHKPKAGSQAYDG